MSMANDYRPAGCRRLDRDASSGLVVLTSRDVSVERAFPSFISEAARIRTEKSGERGEMKILR